MSSSRTAGQARRRWLPSWLTRSVLAAVLGLAVIAMPDSAVQRTDAVLVKVEQSQGIDVSPDVVWILALGSDARMGQPVLRSRADAIQLVGINTKTGAATTIGVPRDSWVSIPGRGSERINAALYFGGPDLMAQAVQNLIGIEPDYVMVASFWGLRGMVDDIGGVTVDSPVAFADPYLRPNGFKVGKNKVDGYGALAFSRIRKDLLRGDFDRSANQQRTIRAIAAKIRANADKPGFLDKGSLAVLKHTDAQIPPQEIYKISRAIAAVKPSKITNCVVQGSIGNVGGASVVLPDTGAARRYGNDARKDAVISSC